jgi:hypothetical protein
VKKNWFSSLCFFKFNLYRLHRGVAARVARRGGGGGALRPADGRRQVDGISVVAGCRVAGRGGGAGRRAGFRGGIGGSGGRRAMRDAPSWVAVRLFASLCAYLRCLNLLAI